MSRKTERAADASPSSLGFRMPAEWEHHEATWIGWPHNRTDWPGKFSTIPWVYGEIVRNLAPGEIVRIIVDSETHEARARRVLTRAGVDLARVEFFRFPTDRGAIMGLYSVFLGLGQIVGSLIAGFAAAALGLDGIFIASIVLLGLALIPLRFLRRYEHYLGPGEPATID